MNKEITELLAIIDMPEDGQKIWLVCENVIQNSEGEKGQVVLEESLADLAFRLRDDFHYALGSVVWDKACWEVWAHEKKRQGSNILDREHLSLETKLGYCTSWAAFWATPIHWIVIALIAKELLIDGDAKNELEYGKKC